jgi:hypothetical protein
MMLTVHFAFAGYYSLTVVSFAVVSAFGFTGDCTSVFTGACSAGLVVKTVESLSADVLESDEHEATPVTNKRAKL